MQVVSTVDVVVTVAVVLGAAVITWRQAGHYWLEDRRRRVEETRAETEAFLRQYHPRRR